MPKLKKRKSEVPEELRPYIFHGVDLDYSGTSEECIAEECPICFKEGKFSVNRTNSKHHCKVCNASGNSAVFLKRYYESLKETLLEQHSGLAEERNLASPDTLVKWGVRWSVLKKEWVVPAYNHLGNLSQIYAYRRIQGKKRFLATPGFKHGLFGIHYKKKPKIILCEGPWDAMCLWETLKHHPDKPLLKTSVLATPGCNVFSEKWSPLFSGKYVTVIFDNDHPKTNEKTGQTNQAGWKGLESVVNKLSSSNKPPKKLKICQWGPDGFNPTLPDGCDIRDYLCGV